jgi:hypothetical protein
MNIGRPTMALVFAGLFCLAGLGTSAADLYLESEQVTQGIPGQPDGKGIIRLYLSLDATMTDLGDVATIIDMQEKMLYELDLEAKTYRRTEIDKVVGIPGLGADAQDLERNPLFQAMVKSMVDSFKVTPTDEVKTIAGYECRKHIVQVMQSSSDYWVTKDFEGYEELRAISDKSARLFMNNPLMKQINIAAMMNALDGLPVHSVTRMMGGTITTTLKKMERKTLDPKYFTVPAGFTRVTD